MIIREATRADEPALRALEDRTPLNLGEEKVFVHHDNFFEMHEMQERSVVMVAEEDGAVIGVCAGALNRTPLAGQERLLLYMHHERIAPEHQRRGVGGALTSAISNFWKEHEAERIESSYWYIATRNMQSRSFAERSGGRPWSTPVSICSIPQAALASSPAPKPIGAGPTYDIVRLINRTHEGQDLFRPYEHVDFGKRLSRSRDYGWGDVYGRFEGDRLVAVAGITKGWVADFGYAAGAEKAMAALLSDLAVLRPGLSILLDHRSSLVAACGFETTQLFPLLFYAPRVEEPAATALLHVDPVYF